MKELQDKLLSVESRIANYSSARNVKILSSHIEDLSEKNGKFNITKMWKLRKKLCPKSLEKPSAKINEKGKLVTQKKEPKELYKNTYISRLRNREILPQYETIFKLKNYLFNLRLKVTSKIRSPDWTMSQLIKVLKSLKNNKSGDHFGMIYELFKPGLIGNDLQQSLLILCNEIKKQQRIPVFLMHTDITSFYKNKGDRRSLENDRGIFGVMKIRSIIDKLSYNDYYEKIDRNMKVKSCT